MGVSSLIVIRRTTGSTRARDLWARYFADAIDRSIDAIDAPIARRYTATHDCAAHRTNEREIDRDRAKRISRAYF